LLPFDRILDRFRTMANVWGDMVCAATVDHFVNPEKLKDVCANELISCNVSVKEELTAV
jgi:Na+/H+-dicarboxylate symporter